MLFKKQKARRNPYLVATLAACGYVLGVSIAKLIWHNQFDIKEILLGAAVFWAIFFFVQRWLLKRLKKR